MTLSIEALAIILLIGRAISVAFISLVIRKQWKLMFLYVEDEIKSFRKTLFTISSIILVMNFVPILIDTLTLFIDTGRSAQVAPISVAYALSNSFTCALLSMFVWVLYRLAEGRAPWPFKRK